MNVNELKNIVGNRFFHVTFKKKDGTIREMTCRTGVKKYVKGNGKPINDGRVGVYEVNTNRKGAAAYRSFYPESVISLKVDGCTFYFNE